MLHQKGGSQEFPPAVGTAGTTGLLSARAALYIRAPLSARPGSSWAQGAGTDKTSCARLGAAAEAHLQYISDDHAWPPGESGLIELAEALPQMPALLI